MFQFPNVFYYRIYIWPLGWVTIRSTQFIPQPGGYPGLR